MKVYHDLNELKNNLSQEDKIGLTIGNFDGVHLGHQELIKNLIKTCKENHLHSLVMTFRPHPQFIFNPDLQDFLILSYEQKLNKIERLGVDFIVEIPFSRDFSTLHPDEFIKRYLLLDGKVSHIHLGHDFSFGANKIGNYEYLRSSPLSIHLGLSREEKVKVSDKVVCSSLIREIIKNGNVDQVKSFLDTDYKLKGMVVKGEGRGRQIGFPTANIDFPSEFLIPGNGVYVTETLYNNRTYRSVTNIGHNPTFGATKKINVETHIFNFEKFIYGEPLEVSFLSKIRDEIKFNSVIDLIEQINKDSNVAREYIR